MNLDSTTENLKFNAGNVESTSNQIWNPLVKIWETLAQPHALGYESYGDYYGPWSFFFK